MLVPTPHNRAKMSDIAKTVLMPGDPLRAKYIAENYLENVYLYNDVRQALGYTGEYKGVKISVQTSGMGIPSMGIYSRELFEGYDVDNIIRIGSAGSLAWEEAHSVTKEVNVGDILVAESVATDSNFLVSNDISEYNPVCSPKLLQSLKNTISELNSEHVKFGKIYTSDNFYSSMERLKEVSQMGIIGVEMETLALYANAYITNKNAIAMFTVSDNIFKGESLSSEERQTGLNKMIEIALEFAIKCEKDRE